MLRARTCREQRTELIVKVTYFFLKKLLIEMILNNQWTQKPSVDVYENYTQGGLAPNFSTCLRITTGIE